MPIVVRTEMVKIEIKPRVQIFLPDREQFSMINLVLGI